MGAFTGDNSPPVNQPETVEQDERGIPTDVEGVFAKDKRVDGGNEFPVFDVEESDFFNNMTDNRKRLRFKSGSPAQEYLRGTHYKIPFFIRHTNSDGKSFIRKIK